jgi:hypothetical protein
MMIRPHQEQCLAINSLKISFTSVCSIFSGHSQERYPEISLEYCLSGGSPSTGCRFALDTLNPCSVLFDLVFEINGPVCVASETLPVSPRSDEIEEYRASLVTVQMIANRRLPAGPTMCRSFLIHEAFSFARSGLQPTVSEWTP